MMRRLLPTRPKLPRLALLISLAVFLAMLILPAAQGAAAPAGQGQPTQTPLVIVATATPSPTPDTPTPDAYEPNNTIADARPIEIGGKIDKLNFLPDGDVDYFVFFVKPDMV